MEYEGEYKKQKDGSFLRHGKGYLYRYDLNGEKIIVYSGDWQYDLPSGYGKLSKIFQEDWEYEGNFYGGVFHGEGELRFNGSNVFKGEFMNYFLQSFLIHKKKLPNSGVFLFNQNHKNYKLIFLPEKQEFLFYILYFILFFKNLPRNKHRPNLKFRKSSSNIQKAKTNSKQKTSSSTFKANRTRQ